MNERKQLEEALEGAPDEVNGYWYTADELKPLGFSDALVAATKDTTKKRSVGALIKGQLLFTTARARGESRVRYFCRQVSGEDPTNNMQGSMEVANNLRGRPSIEDAMRRTRKRRRSTAPAPEGAEIFQMSSRTRRHSSRSNAQTWSQPKNTALPPFIRWPRLNARALGL